MNSPMDAFFLNNISPGKIHYTESYKRETKSFMEIDID